MNEIFPKKLKKKKSKEDKYALRMWIILIFPIWPDTPKHYFQNLQLDSLHTHYFYSLVLWTVAFKKSNLLLKSLGGSVS